MLFLLMPGSGVCSRPTEYGGHSDPGVATVAHAMTATDGTLEVELSSFRLCEPHAQPRPQRAQKRGREPWLSNSAHASFSSMKIILAYCS